MGGVGGIGRECGGVTGGRVRNSVPIVNSGHPGSFQTYLQCAGVLFHNEFFFFLFQECVGNQE